MPRPGLPVCIRIPYEGLRPFRGTCAPEHRPCINNPGLPGHRLRSLISTHLTVGTAYRYRGIVFENSHAVPPFRAGECGRMAFSCRSQALYFPPSVWRDAARFSYILRQALLLKDYGLPVFLSFAGFQYFVRRFTFFSLSLSLCPQACFFQLINQNTT